MLVFLAALTAFTVTLAWPVPVMLARAQWPRRSPGLALLLWQAIALGGALAMFGVFLGIAFVSLREPAAELLRELGPAIWTGPLPAQWGLVNALGLCAALLFGALLCANLIHTAWVTETRRRQHRNRVDLLSSPLGDDAQVRLLDHPAPMAFCLPGMRTLTVLSSGLVELFEEDEFAAVLEHERAHLRGQHHLVLLAFHAWHDALPWFPIASRAERAVAILIELIADDTAAKTVERASIARAIRRLGGSWDDGVLSDTPFATNQAALEPRLARLDAPSAPLGGVARSVVVLLAFVLIAFPLSFVLLLGIAG